MPGGHAYRHDARSNVRRSRSQIVLQSAHGVLEARACLARVLELGPYRFNLCVGESHRLISTGWLAAEEVSDVLATPSMQRRAGDVYARLEAPS
jgi:hypothetical protein